MKIGDKIIDFRLMQDVREGWHLVTAMKDLRAYLVFAKNAAYSGEIGTLGASVVVVDRVALLAAVVRIDRCSSAFGSRGGECRKERCGSEGNEKNGA
jgi:hypothetical protein